MTHISALKNIILSIIAALIVFCLLAIGGAIILARQSPPPEPVITLSAGGALQTIPPQSYCTPNFSKCTNPRGTISTFPFTAGQTAIISLPKEIYQYPWNYYILYAGAKDRIAAHSPFYSGLKPQRTLILHSPKQYPILAVEILVYSLALLNHRETAVIRGHWIAESNSH